MNIQQNICPECGGPTDEGLCPKCRVEKTEWLVCEPRVQCIHCPTCGSLKHGKVWTNSDREHDELAAELAVGAVHLHEDVWNVKIEVDSYDPSPNRTVCTVYVTGTLYGIAVKGECRVLIVWSKEQCDRCCRFSGGYYEGNLQVRATGRKPDPFEKEQAVNTAHEIEEELQETGERLSFITKIDEIKEGMDIVVSSHHLGDLVSRKIVKQLGGRVTTHPKLVGEKKGKKLYRVTYLIRLPRYKKGDVIALDKQYYEIRGIEPRMLHVFDLTEGVSKTLPEETTGRMIGNVRDSEEIYISYLDGDMAGFMDPQTYKNKEIKAESWLNLTEGSPVRVLRDQENDRLVLIG